MQILLHRMKSSRAIISVMYSTFQSPSRRADVMSDVFARRRVDLRETGLSGMDWIRLAQGRDTEMKLRIP
jgi:hypothetical protein